MLLGPSHTICYQLPANSAQLQPLQGHAGVCGNRVPAATWSINSPPTLLFCATGLHTSRPQSAGFAAGSADTKSIRGQLVHLGATRMYTDTHMHPLGMLTPHKKRVCAAKNGSPKLAGNKPAADKTECYSWHVPVTHLCHVHTHVTVALPKTSASGPRHCWQRLNKLAARPNSSTTTAPQKTA